MLDRSALDPWIRRLQGLSQHASHCRRRPIDACQRREGDRKVHWSYKFMILARGERSPVESQRHMPVVRPWTEVRGAGKLPFTRHLISIENHHHVPVAVIDITVREDAPKIARWKLRCCKLQMGERVLHVWRRRQSFLRWIRQNRQKSLHHRRWIWVLSRNRRPQ